MKTQKEIEKEIEILKNEINNRNRSKKEISDRFKISHADRKINLLKALLQQNKEFIEMIKNTPFLIAECNEDCKECQRNNIEESVSKIVSSIIGEEKK